MSRREWQFELLLSSITRRARIATRLDCSTPEKTPTTMHLGIFPTEFVQSLAMGVNDGNGAAPRFWRLPHPRTGVPAMFLPVVLKSSGENDFKIYEVQNVAPAKARSWFLKDKVISDGKMLLLSPVDPTFLLVPILRFISPIDGTLGTFRTREDIFQEASQKLAAMSKVNDDPSMHIESHDILAFASTKGVSASLPRICEVKEITPEVIVFRYSADKTLQHFQQRVERLAASPLFGTSRSLVRALARDGLMEDGKETLLLQGRIRASCDLYSQYLPSELSKRLRESFDLSELEEYLIVLEQERQPLVHTQDKKGKKRDGNKQEEEKNNKKRKGSKASHGVEKLKKANVTGMSKLSTFFVKKS